MRTRLYRILEDGYPDIATGRYVDLFLIVLISLNVIAAIIETVAPIRARYGAQFDLFETVSIVIFTVEYLARIWVCVEDPDLQGRTPLRARLRYMVSPLALVDLMAILPAYLALFVAVDLRWLRLFRLLRLFKLTRYWSALNLLYRIMRDEAQIIGAAIFLLSVIMVLASAGMYVVEHRAQPEAFGNVPAAMWWTISTLTTVGYGDLYPVTWEGRVVAFILMVTGASSFGALSGLIAGSFVQSEDDHQDELRDLTAEVASLRLLLESRGLQQGGREGGEAVPAPGETMPGPQRRAA